MEHVEEAAPLSKALHALYRLLIVPQEDKPPPDEAWRLVEKAKAEMLRWARRPYESGVEEVRREDGERGGPLVLFLLGTWGGGYE